MPLRWRLWIILLATAVAAIALIGFIRRAESFRRAEGFRVAAGRFAEYAGAYDPDHKGPVMFTSCYGEAWDSYTMRVAEDIRRRAGDRPYCAERASYYSRLKRKYERAAARPWLPVPPDPPPAPK